MKKLLLSVFALFLFAAASNAQEQGEIRISAGVALGTKAAIDTDGTEKAGIGINIGGEYLITDVISVAPSYTFFFESEETIAGVGTFGTKISSFNLDGRYYFMTDNVQVYALAGLSFASAEVTTSSAFFGTISVSDNKTGLNIGAGLNLPLADNIGINGQLKYNTPFEQLVVQGGLYYAF